MGGIILGVQSRFVLFRLAIGLLGALRLHAIGCFGIDVLGRKLLIRLHMGVVALRLLLHVHALVFLGVFAGLAASARHQAARASRGRPARTGAAAHGRSGGILAVPPLASVDILRVPLARRRVLAASLSDIDVLANNLDFRLVFCLVLVLANGLDFRLVPQHFLVVPLPVDISHPRLTNRVNLVAYAFHLRLFFVSRRAPFVLARVAVDHHLSLADGRHANVVRLLVLLRNLII
mmetsp:Transcript_56937/g.165288  ORF Transcript_56937/g.165288 Transcript_56937/m.165288 type:complete len:234 (-) Transcript_56937:566-1267(-)